MQDLIFSDHNTFFKSMVESTYASLKLLLTLAYTSKICIKSFKSTTAAHFQRSMLGCGLQLPLLHQLCWHLFLPVFGQTESTHHCEELQFAVDKDNII